MSFSDMHKFFQEGHTKPFEFRLQSLKKLEQLLRQNENSICEALERDFRKPRTETLIAEMAVTLDEVHLACRNLKSWKIYF